MTSQEAGATWLYHGHMVSLEWQSPHARFRMGDTFAGTWTCASSDLDATTGGFVRFGCTNWARKNTTTKARASLFTRTMFIERFPFVASSRCQNHARDGFHAQKNISLALVYLVVSKSQIGSLSKAGLVQPGMPLDECLRRMKKRGDFHPLVVDEPGRFPGIICARIFCKSSLRITRIARRGLRRFCSHKDESRACEAGQAATSYSGQNFHQLVQACSRILTHGRKFDSHALAMLRIANHRPPANFATRHFEKQPDHVTHRRRVPGCNEDAAKG
jgi:hypothetical protein